MLKGIRSYFIAGLLFVVPLVLSVYVVIRMFFWLDGLLNQQVSYLIFHFLGKDTSAHPIPGIGLLALVLVFLVAGFTVRNYIGRRIVKISDLVLSRIPIVGHIYSTLQQIGHAFLSDRSDTFKKAVLFEYPRAGSYSIGFITQDTRGVVQKTLSDHKREDCFSIFVPTTPNPTSGFLLFIPKKDVLELDLSIEEALKLVISGGSIVPAEKKASLIKNVARENMPSGE
jgi:uncharacterized membrane protein